jgi:hypothetical protein
MKQMVVVGFVLLCSSLVLGCRPAQPMALGSGKSIIPPRPADATYPSWEHHCAAVDGSSGQADATAKLLADAGKEGWELVLVQDMAYQRYFCFKRPLFDPASSSMVFEGGVEPSEAERAAAIRTAREAGVLAEKPSIGGPIDAAPSDGGPSDGSQGAEVDVVWEDVIEHGIRVQKDGSYEISKDLIDKLLANPMAMAKGARVVPAMKDGKTVGFKVYAIRARSLYARLGLENGDTLESINGFELSSAEQALEVYTKLREASSLEASVVRRGKPVTLRYVIR